MTVYRIHIRPNGGLADPAFSFAYCLKAQVLGLGWQTEGHVSGISWDAYENTAAATYGSERLSRVRYLKKHVKPDDLLWTRDTTGTYYLAKVRSGWEYLTSAEARDADITNVVRCDILRVPSVDDVPGKVVACFRPSRAIQAIRDGTVHEYSQHLWNRLSGRPYFAVEEGGFESVFPFLSSEETEDVVFLYLQFRGWLVVPNSRKAGTMRYEFYLINRKTHERAIVQVKTGKTALTPSEWRGRSEKVFLFQSRGVYRGASEKGIECLSPREVEEFIHANLDLMPASIAHWARLAMGEQGR